jgi:ABC-type transport system involved in multi-copper enzyme maturation permease subunit
MSFSLLFKDELIGFYKSKVMIFLWFGLSALAVLIHLSSSNDIDGMPLSVFTALLVSSISGLLSSVMLAVNIINEKDTRVYDLFLIRPIKRWYLLVSKFLAVYLCVSIACIIAISVGVLIDYSESQIFFESIMKNVADSFIMTLSIIGISSAFGILIGVVSSSIIVGVILVIFVGNYISVIPTLPLIFNISNPVVFVIIIGIILTTIFMTLAILFFNKKQF